MKINIVEDWRKAKGWLSVHAMLLAGIIQVVWLELPAEMKASLSQKTISIITVVLMVAGIVGRLVKQGGTNAQAS